MKRELSILLLLTILLGCEGRERQYAIEGEIMSSITRRLEDHVYLAPGTHVTNVSQLFRPHEKYPYAWHRNLKKFGKYAGFKNSFYEKYVFFPPGITNRWLRDRELVMMNAEPFPGPDGLMRYLVRKRDDRYSHLPMAEDRVQAMFKELDIVVPKVVPMPPPPPAPPEDDYREPFSHKRYKLFYGLALALGVGGQNWWIVQLATIAVVLILVFFMLFWYSRRSRP